MKKGIEDNRILIKNVNIITMNKDKEVIENGTLVIEGDEIKAVGGADLENKFQGYNIIDGEDGILMPGMINCHCHGSMVPFRSLADDCKDRLKRYLFPLENMLVNKELVYIGAKYAVAEMLLGGVTTYCDMYYFEDEVAKATSELNMRGILCNSIINFQAPDTEEPFGGLDYSIEFIEKWKGHELITPGIAPHAPYTNSDESLKMAYEISKKYEVPFTMHLAEMDFEFEKYKEELGLTPVEYVESLGILDSNFIAAHAVTLEEQDIDILKKHNVKVSHNIGANAKGAKGVAPILKMREKGIDVGLGSDGPMSGNTMDIITQMSLVGKIQKLYNNDRSLFPAVELVEMATMGGSKVLGLENKVGSIEVGKKADITLIETKSVNMQPIYDYYSAVVYSANAGNVDTVIVNGKIVVRNKELVSGNFKEIRRELLKLKDKIEKVAGKL
ncbi:amidohydrolase [Clostridium sp. CF011]|uniref:amidohydrolase n=1 Tax=Clostridium sp. CF011 TaxID=2843318 RepID=UPI001C0B1394|nr:amidohydrolase [Clostridium sp. CF011]MBU3091119.1 amidohydrolase [Clostridium sp. CF011]WAG68965.1 amidohydrolase [Clostridium sp. CF011]